jgi:hypothetical protein
MATQLRPVAALLAGVSTLMDWISIKYHCRGNSVSLRFVFHLHH